MKRTELYAETLAIVVDAGGWIGSNAIFQKSSASDRQLVSAELADAVRAGDLQMRSGLVEAEYALSGTSIEQTPRPDAKLATKPAHLARSDSPPAVMTSRHPEVLSGTNHRQHVEAEVLRILGQPRQCTSVDLVQLIGTTPKMISNVLRKFEFRKQVVRVGQKANMTVWALASSEPEAPPSAPVETAATPAADPVESQDASEYVYVSPLSAEDIPAGPCDAGTQTLVDSAPGDSSPDFMCLHIGAGARFGIWSDGSIEIDHGDASIILGHAAVKIFLNFLDRTLLPDEVRSTKSAAEMHQ